MESLDLKNKQIQLTLMLKLQQLQREQLPGLNYKNLEDVMQKLVWKRNQPKTVHMPLWKTLHEAVNDILSLSADQIVRFLSKQAIIEGYHQELSEFSDLIGGRNV